MTAHQNGTSKVQRLTLAERREKVRVLAIYWLLSLITVLVVALVFVRQHVDKTVIELAITALAVPLGLLAGSNNKT